MAKAATIRSKCNVGFNEETGKFQIEIKGLATPKSEEATRICQEDLNEVIAAFVQDKTTIERGLFDEELVPEELTQVRMGKIVKDKYPAAGRGRPGGGSPARHRGAEPHPAGEASRVGQLARRGRAPTRPSSTACASLRWMCANSTLT